MSTSMCSKRAGDRAEAAVIDTVRDLAPVSDTEAEHYDAEPVTAIGPSDELHFAGINVIESGTPVEIKTCIPRLSSGSRGRFNLRRQQHERLVEDGATYLFAVVEPNTRDPISMKVAAATSVDDVIGSWMDGGEDRGDYAQVRLSNVFEPSEVRA